MWTGGALVLESMSRGLMDGDSILPREPLRQHRLDKNVLVVEEKHLGDTQWLSCSASLLCVGWMLMTMPGGGARLTLELELGRGG